jgi:hypothetical protein
MISDLSSHVPWRQVEEVLAMDQHTREIASLTPSIAPPHLPTPTSPIIDSAQKARTVQPLAGSKPSPTVNHTPKPILSDKLGKWVEKFQSMYHEAGSFWEFVQKV